MSSFDWLAVLTRSLGTRYLKDLLGLWKDAGGWAGDIPEPSLE
jgi:hypothetical protein